MDRTRGRVVLFGGLSVFSSENPETSDGLVGDTWEHSVEVVLESFTISPTIAQPGQPLILLTVNLNILAPPEGVAVLISSLGEQISGGLPKTTFIEGGHAQAVSEITILPQASPGPGHTITASLGKSTKTVSLEIRG
jgi:hypothetical protein